MWMVSVANMACNRGDRRRLQRASLQRRGTEQRPGRPCTWLRGIAGQWLVEQHTYGGCVQGLPGSWWRGTRPCQVLVLIDPREQKDVVVIHVLRLTPEAARPAPASGPSRSGARQQGRHGRPPRVPHGSADLAVAVPSSWPHRRRLAGGGEQVADPAWSPIGYIPHFVSAVLIGFVCLRFLADGDSRIIGVGERSMADGRMECVVEDPARDGGM